MPEASGQADADGSTAAATLPGRGAPQPKEVAQGAGQRRVRIAVLNCEDAAKWSDHIALLRQAYDAEDEDEWVEFPCARTGQVPTLDELDSFDAVICPGSRYSATDDTLVFLPSLLAVLSQISKQCRPQLLGICFGHQAVARALGGQVGKNSGGEFRFAAEQVVCSPQWSQLPYVQAGGDVRGDEGGRGGGGGAERAHCQDEVGEDLLLLTSHGDCVEALPSEATRVATSDSTENEIFVVSDHVLSFQTHPEFTADLMNQRIYPAITSKGIIQPGSHREEVENAQNITGLSNVRVRSIIRRFLHHRSKCL